MVTSQVKMMSADSRVAILSADHFEQADNRWRVKS
jgi:hypothetical protein